MPMIVTREILSLCVIINKYLCDKYQGVHGLREQLVSNFCCLGWMIMSRKLPEIQVQTALMLQPESF